MATQLTYQKKYVKIVDKALKDYWKKAEEKEKKIRDEREREKIQERQREKNVVDIRNVGRRDIKKRWWI